MPGQTAGAVPEITKVASRLRRLGRALLRLVAGAALALAGVGAWGLSGTLEKGSATVVGQNRPINPGATDPLDLSAQNSPALQASPLDPAQLAVASRIDSPTASCALHISSDGGAHWTESAVSFPEGRTVTCFNPDVAFGADGTLYLVFSSIGPVAGSGSVPDAVWLAASRDGGRTMSAPTKVAGALAFQVRLAAHHNRPGRLYLTWLQASQTSSWGFVDDGRPVVVSRTDDGGASWTSPVAVSSPSRRRVVAPSIALGSGGSAFVTYLDVGDDKLDYHGGHEGRGGDPFDGFWSIIVSRTDDDGATWTEALVDPKVVPTQRFLMLFAPGPSIAVDHRSARIYVGFHDGRLGDPDVWVWSSRAQGRRWRGPTRVNDTVEGDGRSQYLPKLGVSPGGRLDVVYYDRRSDPDDVMNEVSLQSSFDHAASFPVRALLSGQAFDSRVGFGSERGMADLGNRLGVVATDAGALAVWTDTRGGVQETGKQDLASSVVALRPPERLRNPLRTAGSGIAVGGAALVLSGIVRASERKPRRLRAGDSGVPPPTGTKESPS